MRVGFYQGIAESLPLKLVAPIIRLFDGRFLHVVLQIGRVVYSAEPGRGVVREEYREDRFKEDDWIFIEIPSATFDEVKAQRWIETQVGKRYDWLGLIMSVVLPLNIENDSHWFCSEIVRRALRESSTSSYTGAYMFDYWVYDHSVSPNELFSELSSLLYTRA